MVLAHGIKQWMDKRHKKELEAAREEGIEQGETRANRAWAEWNARRLDAESRGETFAEPPPNGKVN